MRRKFCILLFVFWYNQLYSNEYKTSTVQTVSFEYNWLHEKHNKTQFSLSLCTLFSMLSKHLEFPSFQADHHKVARIILHLSLFLACTRAFSQLFKASETFLTWSKDAFETQKYSPYLPSVSAVQKHMVHCLICFLTKLSLSSLHCPEPMLLLWPITKRNKIFCKVSYFSKFASIASLDYDYQVSIIL